MNSLRIFFPKVIWLLVVAAAPFYLFPQPSRWVGLLFLPVAWLLSWWSLRKPLPLTPLNPALLLLSVMVLFSAWFTYDINISLVKLAGYVFGISVFFVVAQHAENRRGWLAVVVLLGLAGAAISLLGLSGMFWSEKLTSKIPFLYPLTQKFPTLIRDLPGASDKLHPNEVAGALLWVLIPAWAFLLASFKKNFLEEYGLRAAFGKYVLRIAWAAVCLLVLGTFILTQSRSGYIGLFAALALIGVLLLPLKLRRLGLAGLLVSVVILAAFLVPYFQSIMASPEDANVESASLAAAVDGELDMPAGDALQTVKAENSLAAVSPALSTATFEARVKYWQWSLFLLRDFPLTGIGMNTFRYAVFPLFPLACYNVNCDLGHVHNEFLQVGLELGLPGLVAFIALHLGAFWMLFILYQKTDGEWAANFPARWMVLGVMGGLASHFVYGLTDAVTLGAKPNFLFWVLLGLVAGLYQQARNVVRKDF